MKMKICDFACHYIKYNNGIRKLEFNYKTVIDKNILSIVQDFESMLQICNIPVTQINVL